MRAKAEFQKKKRKQKEISIHWRKGVVSLIYLPSRINFTSSTSNSRRSNATKVLMES